MSESGIGVLFRHLALEIGLDLADPLRPAAEAGRGVQIGVVVELDEGFERHAEAPAIGQDGAMVVRDPPGAGVEVEPRIEGAVLPGAAELGVGVAAAQRPVATAGPGVEFQHLDRIARVAQFERRRHAGEPRPEDQHRRALGVALELDRPPVAGLGREAEARHGVVQRRAARHPADHREGIATRHGAAKAATLAVPRLARLGIALPSDARHAPVLCT